MTATNLYGEWHVTPTSAAIADARKLFPKFQDYYELKKQSLKLAFWNGGDPKACDLDWDKIEGMQEPKAYELRIDDTIGGCNNLRVVFWMFKKELILPGDVLPRLWIVSVLQKKRMRFSTFD